MANLLELLVVIITFAFGLGQNLEIKNLRSDPLLLLKIKDCRIQTGNYKIIHPINLTRIEKTIIDLSSFANEFPSKSSPLFKTLDLKIKNLEDNFQMLKPKRHRRWNALGTAWKWLAGSPDANDLHIINSTMNQLIDGNNDQITVNQQLDNRLLQLTSKMNEIVALENLKFPVLKELEVLKLIVKIDSINDILSNLQDAIVSAKLSLPHNRILTIHEILEVKTLLSRQGVDVTSLEEVFDYTIPKVITNTESLLYILQIPQMSDNASSIMIRPLTVNGEKIAQHPTYLIQFKQQLFTTIKPFDTIQLSHYIEKFDDTCIHPLISGRNSSCTVFTNHSPEIKYLTEGKIVLDNVVNFNLTSNCGPHDRTLTGNFLISFQNCTIAINNEQFTLTETTLEAQDMQAAFYDLHINRTILELHNIETLKTEALLTRKKLQHIFRNHQLWVWGLFTKTTVISFIVLTLICKKRRPTPTNQQPWQLWLQTQKNEDVLETTPGEVTLCNKAQLA